MCVTDCYFIVNVLDLPFASLASSQYTKKVLLLQETVNGELKILQNRKTAFEVKGQRFTTGKVIKRLFNIDLYTYLAIYRNR